MRRWHQSRVRVTDAATLLTADEGQRELSLIKIAERPEWAESRRAEYAAAQLAHAPDAAIGAGDACR